MESATESLDYLLCELTSVPNAGLLPDKKTQKASTLGISHTDFLHHILIGAANIIQYSIEYFHHTILVHLLNNSILILY